MATFKPVIFKSKKSNHIKSDGTTNIKIKIYHNRDSQYVSTDLYVHPEAFSKGGEVDCGYPEADLLNYELGETIQRYRKLAISLGGQRLAQMSCKSLKKYIVNFSEQKNEFIDFVKFSRHVIARTKKKKTAEWYEDSLNALVWHLDSNEINVNDITTYNLKLFIEQLRMKGKRGQPLQPGTINNYLRGIRALFNKCKLQYNEDELGIIKIPNDPFPKIKIPKYKRTSKNISINELKTIRDGIFKTERENIGRDVFMMQFYLMGININDLYMLNEPLGTRLEYRRSKTETDENINNFKLSIKIEPELQSLINKYSKDRFLSVLKCRYSNSYNLMKAVNKGLKIICDEFNMPKITSNWARHTWASLARNKADIAKADVDFCLGHVNNDYKMADIYIDIDYSIFDKSNRKVLDLLE